MSEILNSFVNVFTPEEYPPDEDTGRSEVPLEDIYAAVYERVDNFVVNISQMGYRPDGGPYVGVDITLPIENGNFHTVVGSADAKPQTVGMSGVQTIAIKNAFLRNLRMGEALYQSNTLKEEDNNTETPAEKPQSAPQTQRQGNSRWDGELAPKQGKWAGTKYKDIPVEVLQGWAQAGISTAVAELERRGINASAGSSVQKTLNNSPFRTR